MDVLLPFFAQYYNEWSVKMEINLVNGTLVLVTLWLPQELRSASETFGNSYISPCRESNQNPYACTLSLPYYMWYLSNVRNQQCNRWFKMLSPA